MWSLTCPKTLPQGVRWCFVVPGVGRDSPVVLARIWHDQRLGGKSLRRQGQSAAGQQPALGGQTISTGLTRPLQSAAGEMLGVTSGQAQVAVAQFCYAHFPKLTVSKFEKKMTDDNETLEDWLETVHYPSVLGRPLGMSDLLFPSDEIRDEFLCDVHLRSEDDVIAVLDRFLFTSMRLPMVDKRDWEIWRHQRERLLSGEVVDESERQSIMEGLRSPRVILLASYFEDGEEDLYTWEGVSWIRGLLPDHPRIAIDALEAYAIAHAWAMTDYLIWSISDAQALIHARYIGIPENSSGRRSLLANLEPRQFEVIVYNLYGAMGYEVTLTPKSKDGGRDVIAVREADGMRETVLVECKRRKKPRGPEEVRALYGSVKREKANRGVFVSVSGFTKAALAEVSEDGIIEPINGLQLVVLLNEYLGHSWPARIDYYGREPSFLP
ncbi:restriction endonuclease [Streptomyces sedi]|nr:restriction endonuclease [Streptomyces sedi]